MAEEHLESVSRRNFATGAGVLAVTSFAAGAAAAAELPPAPGRAMSAAPRATRKADLAQLSNKLYNSPAARAEFLANPQGYAGKLGLKSVGPGDLSQVQKMIADGFCCNGCGCSGATDTLTNPSQ
jgi:hypothetical protein